MENICRASGGWGTTVLLQNDAGVKLEVAMSNEVLLSRHVAALPSTFGRGPHTRGPHTVEGELGEAHTQLRGSWERPTHG